MLIYNIDRKAIQSTLPHQGSNEHLLIFASPCEVPNVAKKLNLSVSQVGFMRSTKEQTRFETHNGYDFIEFLFISLENGTFVYHDVQIYHCPQYLLLVFDERISKHKLMLEKLLTYPDRATPLEAIALHHYHFFAILLTRMLDCLSDYEEILLAQEQAILCDASRYNFDKIVESKGTSFTLKKQMRFLLPVGDQLTENENELIPHGLLHNFQSIDLRINRLYEFTEQLHEMTEHLMDLYNSRIADRTNNLINKLTIFTVFATPLSVISGIYGMNFSNMPELQHPYGYFIVLGFMALSMGATYFVLKKIKLL